MRKTSVMVADLIRDGILEGRLRPGDRLKEDMLAKELAVSRTPVREAIAMLQAEGLLESQQHRGAQVRSYTPAELEQMYDLRGILEGYGARRAATRITARELARLRTSVDRMEKLEPKDLEHLVQQNGVFHDTILQAADSERLVTMVTQTRAVPLIYQSYAWYTTAQLSLSLEYHRRVLAALERGDAEQAERDMRHHLFNAREALTSAYAGANDEDDTPRATSPVIGTGSCPARRRTVERPLTPRPGVVGDPPLRGVSGTPVSRFRAAAPVPPPPRAGLGPGRPPGPAPALAPGRPSPPPRRRPGPSPPGPLCNVCKIRWVQRWDGR